MSLTEKKMWKLFKAEESKGHNTVNSVKQDVMRHLALEALKEMDIPPEKLPKAVVEVLHGMYYKLHYVVHYDRYTGKKYVTNPGLPDNYESMTGKELQKYMEDVFMPWQDGFADYLRELFEKRAAIEAAHKMICVYTHGTTKSYKSGIVDECMEIIEEMSRKA